MDFFNDMEDEEVDEEREVMYGGRDGLIFLIDSTQPMFVKDDDQIPFLTAMECYKTTMLNKIISSDRDLISVVLFGTSKSENQLNVPHITTFHELSEPSAEKIKQLEKIINSDNFDGFADKYGHSSDFALHDVFWLCQTLFSASHCKLSSHRILLFTNSSDPHAGNMVLNHQARIRAMDLAQADIELELLYMGSKFNPSIFYKEFMQLARGESVDDFELPDPTSSFDELLERTCRLDCKKRALCKLHFRLGAGVTLAVNLYNLLRKTTMPKKVFLDRVGNEEVKSKSQLINAVTGDVMAPAELRKAQLVADRPIAFRADEVRSLRKICSPGLELMGFKPSSRVKANYHIKPSAFIYPEDGLIAGSRTLFVALLERCAARSVVPICYLTSRENSTPQLVGLVPQLEEISNNVQKLPPGFHVVYLPYCDNIRTVELDTPMRAKPEQVAKMQKIVKKLKFSYNPSQIDNPRLQKQWSNIEAMALGHDQPREVPDHTLPNYDQMAAKLQNLSLEFMEEVYPESYDPSAPPKKPAYKRTSTGGSGSAAKVPKVASTSSDAATLAREGKLDKLTVPKLKEYLTSVGVRYLSTMKKADLVDLAKDHYEQNK